MLFNIRIYKFRFADGVATVFLEGIVIKYENMTYRTAVHYAHLVLSLYGKASKYIRDLFEHPDVSGITINRRRLNVIFSCYYRIELIVLPPTRDCRMKLNRYV